MKLDCILSERAGAPCQQSVSQSVMVSHCGSLLCELDPFFPQLLLIIQQQTQVWFEVVSTGPLPGQGLNQLLLEGRRGWEMGIDLSGTSSVSTLAWVGHNLGNRMVEAWVEDLLNLSCQTERRIPGMWPSSGRAIHSKHSITSGLG